MKLQLQALRSSLTLKVLFIAFLVLLLLIPMGMIEDIVRERNHLYRQANEEITRTWGEGQLLTTVLLTLPDLRAGNTGSGWIEQLRYRHLVPESATVRAEFDTQVRYRGIYRVPVYTARIVIDGTFPIPEEGNTGMLDRVLLQLPFTTVKPLKKLPVLEWNGEAVSLQAVEDDTLAGAVIFQAAIDASRLDTGEFRLVYETAGSMEFNLLAPAKQTMVEVHSDWGSPSFHGDYFPDQHHISESGFSANWNISNLFLAPFADDDENLSIDTLDKLERYGFRFLQPADTYQLVTRSTKYAVLFIGLSFLVYFLLETLGGARLHTMHYLLVGLANCIFYLLLLSLAEHIDFYLAYVLGALASSLLTGLYSGSALGNRKRGVLVFTLLASLYGYLFITLRSEAYALLIGSVGLFVILAALMYLTRHTDWHSLNPGSQT